MPDDPKPAGAASRDLDGSEVMFVLRLPLVREKLLDKILCQIYVSGNFCNIVPLSV